MGKYSTAITIILSLFTLLYLGIPIFRNINKFTEKFDLKFYQKKYNQSQYMVPRSKNPISDEEFYSYAGYQYAKGVNPILINSDHPPLGKYFIGWFTLIFGNSRIVSLAFALASMFMIALIVYTLTKSPLLVALTVTILSLDTVYLDQIIYSPVLDIIQVFFLLLFIYFFYLFLQKKSTLLLIVLGVTMGSMSAVKIYFPTIFLLTVTFIILFLKTKNILRTALYLAVIALMGFLTYVSTYANYFAHGYSFRNFLGVQKWMFLYWKNNAVEVSKYYFDIIPFVLFNRWKVWWGNTQYIHFVHWSIFWAIFFLAGIFCVTYFFYYFFQKIRLKKFKTNPLNLIILFLSIWIILFTLYLCYIPISPRYLMMLYFPIYILISLFLQNRYGKSKN